MFIDIYMSTVVDRSGAMAIFTHYPSGCHLLYCILKKIPFLRPGFYADYTDLN